MRGIAGPRHCGLNWALTRISGVSSFVKEWNFRIAEEFCDVVPCRHKVSKNAQSRGNGVVKPATASGVAFKTKA